MIYLLLISDMLMVATFIWRLPTLPPQIPLFYSKIAGEEQLADTWMIFILLLLANISFFFNNYLVKRFFSQNEYAKIILKFLNIFIIIGFGLIFIKIIFLIS